MGNKKKEEDTIVLDGAPVMVQCGDHQHFAGFVDGVLRKGPKEQGEVIYESKASVGGGNPKYEANYEQINWDN